MTNGNGGGKIVLVKQRTADAKKFQAEKGERKMKKLLALIVTAMLAIAACVGLTACGESNQKYVAKAIAGIDVEEYGYCISKTATNHDGILAAINAVIAETSIDEVVSYYTAKSKDETPSVNLNFADLSDNTAGTLDIYTCSGFEPYEFVDESKNVIGVDIYLMELVAEKLNMKIIVHDVDFDGIVGSIATKDNAIGAAGITITETRKQSVDFSNAYYSSVQYIISKDSEGFTAIKDLAGKKIGVQKGTTGCNLIQEAIDSGVLKGTGATILEYDTGAVAFTAMKQGKCDYVVIDELPAQKLVG